MTPSRRFRPDEEDSVVEVEVLVPSVNYSELSSKEKGESSADIRARIEIARDVQTKRFNEVKGLHTNARQAVVELSHI